MVPDSSTVGNLSSSSDSLTVGGTNNFSADSTPSDTLQTESLRVAIIRNQLESQQLNGQAIVNFSQQRLAPTPTNKEYCKNQLRFLTWTQLNAAVPHGTFSGKDLANFLADMRHSYQLQVVATLNALRAGVNYIHLHKDPQRMSAVDQLVNPYLINTLIEQDSPVTLHHRPPIDDVSPALVYACRSAPSLSGYQYQEVTATKIAGLFLAVAILSSCDPMICTVFSFFLPALSQQMVVFA